MKFKEKTHIPWSTPRRCKFCGCQFTPKRAQDEQQVFCQASHRDAYYRSGAMPFPKLIDELKKQILNDFAEQMREEFALAIRAEVEKLQKTVAPDVRQAYANFDGHENTDNHPDPHLSEPHLDDPAARETEAEASADASGAGAAVDVESPAVRGDSAVGAKSGDQPGLPPRREERAAKRVGVPRAEVVRTEEIDRSYESSFIGFKD